jgi:hypothetical protein
MAPLHLAGDLVARPDRDGGEDVGIVGVVAVLAVVTGAQGQDLLLAEVGAVVDVSSLGIEEVVLQIGGVAESVAGTRFPDPLGERKTVLQAAAVHQVPLGLDTGVARGVGRVRVDDDRRGRADVHREIAQRPLQAVAAERNDELAGVEREGVGDLPLHPGILNDETVARFLGALPRLGSSVWR